MDSEQYVRGHAKAAGAFAFLSGCHFLWLIYYHIKSHQEFGTIMMLILMMALCCFFTFLDRYGGELFLYQTLVKSEPTSFSYAGELIIYDLLQSVFLICYSVFFFNNSAPFREHHSSNEQSAFKVTVYTNIILIFIHTALYSYVPFHGFDSNSIPYKIVFVTKMTALVLFMLINVVYCILYWQAIAEPSSPLTLKVHSFAKYGLVSMGLLILANLIQLQTFLAPIQPPMYNATTLLISEILIWSALIVITLLKLKMDVITTKNDENAKFQSSPTRRNPSPVQVKVTRLV